MKYSLVVPTRGRPELFSRMYWSCKDTASFPDDVEVLAYIDDDDPEKKAYLDLGYDVGKIVGPRIPVPTTINVLAGKATGDILMMCADDTIFRTDGWDYLVAKIMTKLPDGLWVAGPSAADGFERICHWFTGRQWFDLFGYIAPPYFEHFYSDLWVQEVAKPCQRLFYLTDVVVEHMHPKFGKGEHDDTYESKRLMGPDGRKMAHRDKGAYNQLAGRREEDILRLRCALGALQLVA